MFRTQLTLSVSVALASSMIACSGDDETTPPTPTPDTTPPSVTITDDSAGVASGDVNFTFTFSEDVGTSFTADDIDVMGATPGAFVRVSGTQATLVASPPAEMTGTITVSVPAMRFEDAAGNQNADAATATQDFDTTSSTPDTTPPTVAITDDAAGTATGDVTFTFTFSEDVGTSFTVDDVTVASGTAGAFAADGQTATLVVAPPAEAMGTITITVDAGTFEDAAGNANADAATAEQAFDTRPAGPFDGVIFGDDFGTDVSFAGFDGAINDATVDTTEAHVGAASLRIVVPATDYTGGAFVAAAAVDVSGFNAVTFWAKADAPHSLNVVGTGNDADDTTFATEIQGALPLTTAWTQFTIPIPTPSALTRQTGLFHLAEGADEGAYTMWVDDIRYTTVPPGTFTNLRPSIADATEALGVSETFTVGGTTIVLAVDGSDVTLAPAAPAYFDYTSSDEAVATVDGMGVVTAIAEGTAQITASLGGVPATGSVTVNVGAGCMPTGPNLANNGGFETGDFSCVQQFTNGGSQSITTMNPHAGTYAAHLVVTAMDNDTVIKFANLTPGAFTAGQTIHISFEMRGAVTPGGVAFAEFFSELDGGGVSAAELLFGGPVLPDANPDTWTKFTTTALTGPDTEGGITLQLKAASGAGTADIYFDDICVSTTPCP